MVRPSSSMAEQWTFNPMVQGSSPWGATTILPHGLRSTPRKLFAPAAIGDEAAGPSAAVPRPSRWVLPSQPHAREGVSHRMLAA